MDANVIRWYIHDTIVPLYTFSVSKIISAEYMANCRMQLQGSGRIIRELKENISTVFH